MKKRLLTLTLALTLALSIIACGKSEEEKEMEAIQKELEEAGLGELSEFEEAIIAEELAIQAEKEAQAKTQEGYKVYDKVAEWNTVEEPLLAVQIDNTLFEIGVTVGEIMQQAIDSEVLYQIGCDYNGKPTYTQDMIVEANTTKIIDICRDNAKWFSIYCYNPTDNVISIDDCLCYEIMIEQSVWNKHTILLGMNYDEWCSIKYDEVETKMQSIDALKDCEIESNQTEWTYSKDIVKETNGKRYLYEVKLVIKVDTTTGKIGTYWCNVSIPKEYYDLVPLESFENLPDGAWEKISEEINAIFESNKDKYSSMKLVEAVLYKEYDFLEDKYSEDITLRIYCEAVTTDGQTVYKTESIINPLLADGTFVTLPEYSSMMLFGAESSLEKCINTYEDSDSMVLERVTF